MNIRVGQHTFGQRHGAAVDKLKMLGTTVDNHYVIMFHHKTCRISAQFRALRQRRSGAVKDRERLLRQHYAGILASDAIFIVNLEKNGIANYIAAMSLWRWGRHM